MRVFRELYFTGDVARADDLIAALEASLPADWTRATDLEDDLNDEVGPPMYCFVCTRAENRSAAALWIAPRSDTPGLYVSNIVPRDENELGKDQYNSVLEDFHRRVASVAAPRAGWSAELTGDEKDLEVWLGREGAKRLRAFSAAANKATGAAHPLDADRWRRFLIAAHQADADFDAARLAEWLVSDGWNADAASDLAVEYEQGRDLLRAYDNERE